MFNLRVGGYSDFTEGNTRAIFLIDYQTWSQGQEISYI